MKISVVVPFYGNPKNQVMHDMLARCIDSIEKQAFEDYELIVSREGTDLSSSRNWGIEHAHGDYLMFVDADDYISEDLFAALADAIKAHPEADIIEFPTLVHEGRADEHLLTFEEKEYTNLINDYWLGCKAYTHSYACNKIYKRHLFDEVRFPVGRKFEDVYALPLVLDAAQKVRTTSKGLYHYVWNKSGICAKAGIQDLTQLLEAHIGVINRWRLHEKKGFSEYFMHVLNIQIDVYKAGGSIILPSYKIESFRMDIKKGLKFIAYKMLGTEKMCKLWKKL